MMLSNASMSWRMQGFFGMARRSAPATGGGLELVSENDIVLEDK